MPEPSLPEGILLRANSLVIDFRYRGQRCRETLKHLEPSKTNIRFAARKRATILLEITQGTFDYAHHFPDSKKANLLSPDMARHKTISTALDEWLAVAKASVGPGTYRNYVTSTENYMRPAFGHLTLQQLTRSAIQAWVANDLTEHKASGVNARLGPLKAVIKNAIADRLLTHDPLLNVRPTTDGYEEPDPLTRAEIDAVLDTTLDRPSEMNMVSVAIWTGLRPGELLALAWEDIDWRHNTLHVRRALSRDGYKVPKTQRSTRTVELLAPARQALERQRALTELRPGAAIPIRQRDNRQFKTETLRFVFIDSRHNAPFATVERYRRCFWEPLLVRAKVRNRGCKITRHTFISQMLTAGLPKEWIIRQVGHASAAMIDNHYGKWMREDALDMARLADEKLGFGHMAVTGNSDKEKNA